MVIAEGVFDSSPYLTLLEIQYPLLHHSFAALLIPLQSHPITVCNLQNCTAVVTLSSSVCGNLFKEEPKGQGPLCFPQPLHIRLGKLVHMLVLNWFSFAQQRKP